MSNDIESQWQSLCDELVQAMDAHFDVALHQKLAAVAAGRTDHAPTETDFQRELAAWDRVQTVHRRMNEFRITHFPNAKR